jgi:hypothetical protein
MLHRSYGIGFPVSRHLALINTEADYDDLRKIHDGGHIYKQMGAEVANDRVHRHVKN